MILVLQVLEVWGIIIGAQLVHNILNFTGVPGYNGTNGKPGSVGKDGLPGPQGLTGMYHQEYMISQNHIYD